MGHLFCDALYIITYLSMDSPIYHEILCMSTVHNEIIQIMITGINIHTEFVIERVEAGYACMWK